MPDMDDLNSNDIAPEPEPTPAPTAPATPTFSLGDVRTLVAESVREAMREVTAPMRTAPAPREEPEPEGASEDDYANNLPAAIQKEIRRGVHGLRKEMAQFRDFGLSRLGELTERSMESQLPYFGRYKDEIKAELANLNPAFRTDPNVIRIVHDSVAMRHEGERIEEARREAVRVARGDAPSPSGHSGRGQPPKNDIPTPEDLGFNADQIDDINSRGGQDAFASRISGGRYKNWAEYAKAQEGLRGAPGKGRGKVIQFARMEPKKGAAGM